MRTDRNRHAEWTWMAALVLALGCLSLPTRMAAFEKPAHESLPDIDARRVRPQPARFSPEQAAAARRLQDRLPTALVELDDVTGTPKFVRARDRFLTGPEGRGRSLSAKADLSGAPADPHRPIKAFLEEHAGLFGHGPELIAQATLQRDHVSAHNGLRSVVWQQHLDGIPVYEGVLIGHLTKAGELVSVASQFVARPAEAVRAPRAAKGEPGEARRLEAERAVEIAAAHLGVPLAPGTLWPLDARPEGEPERQHFVAEALPGEVRARLVWLPMDRAALRLCWQIELTRPLGGERYRVLVDAHEGEVWLRRCLTVYLSDATYRVFTSDSPSPFTPGHRAPSTNQPPEVGRALLTLSALNTNASRIGWINDGVNETRGNNVNAHLDVNADDLPDLPRPQGQPFRVFDFPVDLTQAPESYGDAAVVQFFYWCNWAHDQLYELGFTEAAGNFQKDNFGRGGWGNDAMIADAQDGSGVNNANYTPAPDGEAGRIQMYVFNGPTPARDGDFDAEIILHEYAHGLTDRLVGGGVGISALQSGGLGEGWSDFYALAMLSEPGDDLDAAYPMGGYATYQFYGLTENYYFGIRRYPYSTDLAVNPLTFKDIDPTQISPHTNVVSSPLFPFNPAYAGEVHNAGEVWCVALWDARANLVRKHGFAVGNRLILQLVTDGLKLSPPNPTFLQARDAIIQADLVTSGGANWTELWSAFARRGLGFSATSPGSSTTVGVGEAFDLPDALLITPANALSASGPAGGPLAPQCRTYLLTNHSTELMTWAVAVDQPWLTVAPTFGALAPRGSTNVTLCLAPPSDALPLGSYAGLLHFTNVTSGYGQQREAYLRVMGFAAMPFEDGFEEGGLNSAWLVSGRGAPRVAVTEERVPNSGSFHVVMDSATEGLLSRNELTLGLDLAGYTNVVLSFWAKGFGDEPDSPPPSPFLDGADFDGVAISTDGVSWYEAQSLRELSGSYTQLVVRLDDALAEHGLAYNATFRVRFNQFDNFAAPYDGIAIDDVVVRGLPAWRLGLTLPRTASEGDFGLTNAGRVTLASPAPRDLLARLTSSDESKAVVPATVWIAAGTTQAAFTVTIVDNTLLDGTQPVVITAAADGYIERRATVLVRDNETARLRLALPQQIREGEAVLPPGGWVACSGAVAKDTAIRLTSSDTNELIVSPIVVIRSGDTWADLGLAAVDDQRLDGPQTVTITAHVDNWQDGQASVQVLDDDVPALRVVLPERASEGNGVLTNAGRIRLSGFVSSNLPVSLATSPDAQVTVPASVTVPAGTNEAAFDLTLGDDTVVQGLRTNYVGAGAAGFAGGQAAIVILDDETPPQVYEPWPSHELAEVSPRTRLTWYGGFGEVMVNGGFETGDFTGWKKNDLYEGTFIINDGKLDPEGPDGPMPPYEGRFNAMSEQTGNGVHELAQWVLIPHDAKSARLTWVDRLRNHGLVFDPNDQEYRVEVQDHVTGTTTLVFATQPGDPATNDWTARSFDLTPYRGHPVRIAFLQFNDLGYFNAHVDRVSVELGTTGTTTFDLYFGTNPVPGAAEFLGATTNMAWEVPPLALETTYYWQVVSRRGEAVTPGPVWQFTTRGVGGLDHFEWSTLAPTQQLGQPFTVTLTARDDLGNVVSNFAGPVVVQALPEPQTVSAILITEVDAGNDDRVEFVNVTGRAMDIGGWQIHLYDGRYWPQPRATFGIPTNTACGPFEIFTLKLFGKAPGAYPNFIAGTNLNWGNLSPRPTNQIAVALRDATGVLVDFFCAHVANPREIQKPAPIPREAWSGNAVAFNTNNSFTFQRVGQADHHTSNDWVLALGSVGTFNAYFRLPFEPPAHLVLWPTNLTDFRAGVWTGQLTLHSTAPGLRLLASDPGGVSGWSEPFSVQARNDVSLWFAQAPDVVTLADDVTLTLVVSNSGPGLAEDVIVVVPLPDPLSFGTVQASQGETDHLGGVVFSVLGDLPAGGQATLQIVTTATRAGQATNTATMLRDGADGDEANDSTTAVTTVNWPLLFPGTADVTEGDTSPVNLSFPMRLLSPCRLPVSVRFATSNNTALAGQDFIEQTGVLTFAPGVTQQSVLVPVLGDLLDEASEQLQMHWFAPSNALLAASQVRGRINDNDREPVLSLSPISIAEPAPGQVTQAVFRVQLSAPSGLPVSLRYTTSSDTATTSRDFELSAGLVMFAPGVTSQPVVVRVVGDMIYEPDEKFLLMLSHPTNATLQTDRAAATIQDNGFVALEHFTWGPVRSPQYAGFPFPVTISARDGREQLFPGFNGHVALRTVTRSESHTVGSDTNTWEFPLSTLFHDARTQVIYPAAALGGPGQITALALEVADTPGQTLSNWTLRLKPTPLTRYARAAWESEGWTLVYQSDESVLDTGWVTFPFREPFAYDGTNSLMVDLSFDNADYSHDGACRATLGAQPRTVFFRTDSAFGPPLSWSGTNTPPPALSRWAPNIRLLLENSAPAHPPESGAFVAGIWSGEITVATPATNVFLTATDADGHSGNGNAFVVEPGTDRDGDGLPDAWEQRYFGTLEAEPDADSDGDGLTNREEFEQGTNPVDSVPGGLRASIAWTGRAISIRWPTEIGRTYRVEWTARLHPPIVWQGLAGAQSVAGTGDVVAVIDANVSEARRFYRVRLAP